MEKSVVNEIKSEDNKENNPITFKEERKQFIQGLTRAQNHAQIMEAQDAEKEKQLKLFQIINRLKRQEIVEEEQEL